ncbi:MAG: reverse transcriptase domain-containing protein [Myxococcota bacterium]
MAARSYPDRVARARRWSTQRARSGSTAWAELARPAPALVTPAGRADDRSLRWSTHDDPDLVELRAAFRLSWAEIADWDWPSRTSLQPFWAGQRFRLRSGSTPERGSTASIGADLAEIPRPWSGLEALRRQVRLHRLEELNAPAVIVDHEREQLAAQPDPLGLGGLPDDRLSRRRALQEVGTDEDEPQGYGYGRMARQMAALAADVTLARRSGRPLHVYKTDLADFFPAVSHAVVEELLAGVGVSAVWRRMVLRVLAIPLGGGERATRGLPLSLEASEAIARLLVDVLLSEARAAGGPAVRAWAMVDDIVLASEDAAALQRARAALEAAVGRAGLAVQPAKTGALSIGAPPAAPDLGPIAWGLCTLTEAGWRLAGPPVALLLDATRQHVEAQQAVLDRVAAWRAQLTYAWTLLAPHAALAEDHLDTVRRGLDALRELPLTALDGTVHPGFGPLVRLELATRFRGGEPAAVPDAWLHWPISAGGLGLAYPLADLVPLTLAEPPWRPAPDAPFDPDDAAWADWYEAQLQALEPVTPGPSPSDALVQAFVVRGAQRGQPAGLSPRWRWVLATFGPDVLDAFGTYAFVASDLVPASLIREARSSARRSARPPRPEEDDDIAF